MTAATTHLEAHELQELDAYWRAANYLSVGQIYLLDNPLLREPLRPEHVTPRLLGHWGTTPGLNFVFAHLNRVIRNRDLDAIYVTGPGHGGPGLVANAYLEGTYSEVYPNVTRDAGGMQRLFRQFSFPGGVPSHVAAETPGSIHEGGELGYALAHAYGAAFDNPDLLVACVIGDGEAETGPLATSWHANKFLNPRTDGAVLPILHLNGYKIANPTVLARIPEVELLSLLEGYGYRPLLVSGGFDGEEPTPVHQRFAAALDEALDDIARIQQAARAENGGARPRWPMIVLRTPKGWTGPKEVDGLPVEGTWRSHQVPMTDVRENPEHLRLLEEWLRSYGPEELFDEEGRLVPELAELPPSGESRMSAVPHANGGELLRDLLLPDFRGYAVDVAKPGTTFGEATRVLGGFLRDVTARNPGNFRLFGPDETASNRLGDVFTVTARAWDAETAPTDEGLAPDGRVMEILSEHLCQGWLEGYLLTGRHGLFNCYEAFIHIVDSMFNQHAKWLKVTRQIPWRRPIASLNYLLSSHVWRQDHNGFSHQDPGFIDHVVNKKAEIIRVYLPPDANTLLSVADHCLRSRHYVNVIVAGKQPALNYLSMEDAIIHCTRGLGIWEWASSDAGGEPDVVMACCGDVPTLETLAAVAILREHLPDLKVRVVNVVDLMRLQPESEHPHGLPDSEFDSLFTTERPIVFAYHGYPWLIHRLSYRRRNHGNLHVRGYKEEGTTTTPFDMVMLNDLDRFHLVIDVIDRVPGLAERAARLRQVDEPQALARLRGRVGTSDRVVRGGRNGRPHRRCSPSRARRCAVPRSGRHRSECRGRDRRPRSTRAAAQRAGGLRHRPGAPGVSGRAARRCLRHVVSPHDPGRGGGLRASPDLARGVGHTAFRVPRPLGRVVRRARARPPRPADRRAPSRRLPPRRRLLGDGGERRPVRGYDDGLLAARGHPDDDEVGLSRPRRASLRAPRVQSGRGRDRPRSQLRLRDHGACAWRGRDARDRAGRVRRRSGRATRARRLRAPSHGRRRRHGCRRRRSGRARFHGRNRRAFRTRARTHMRTARLPRRRSRPVAQLRRRAGLRRGGERLPRARRRHTRARGSRRCARGESPSRRRGYTAARRR